jgi:hypothetical protein
MLTKAIYWSLSWARWIQRTASHLMFKTILILSYHLRLDLQSGIFPLGLPSKTVYAFLISPRVLYSYIHPSHPPCYDNPNNIWWNIQVTKFLLMQSSPVYSIFLLLSPCILLSTPFSNTLNLFYYHYHRHLVGLLGRGIGPEPRQARVIHRTKIF